MFLLNRIRDDGVMQLASVCSHWKVHARGGELLGSEVISDRGSGVIFRLLRRAVAGAANRPRKLVFAFLAGANLFILKWWFGLDEMLFVLLVLCIRVLWAFDSILEQRQLQRNYNRTSGITLFRVRFHSYYHVSSPSIYD